MSEIYFSADTHFWHKSIVKYANRPWPNVEQMNEGLITAWNKRVTMKDTVYFLGDFCWRDAKEASLLLGELNGKIHLVQGNHDKRIVRSSLVQGTTKFISINQILELNINRQHIVLCHYPMLTWNKRHYDSWQLHGHSHNTLRPDPNAKRMDVGVDCSPTYAPFHLDEVRKVMDTRGFEAVDHHTKKQLQEE